MTVVDRVHATGCKSRTPEASLGTNLMEVPPALAVTVGREAAGPDMSPSLRSGTQVVTVENGDAVLIKVLLKGDSGDCV